MGDSRINNSFGRLTADLINSQPYSAPDSRIHGTSRAITPATQNITHLGVYAYFIELLLKTESQT